MLMPPTLRQGDTIAIVAPARMVTTDEITHAVQIFESWGLRPSVGKSLFGKTHTYFAATDAERIRDFQQAIDNPDVKAIIAARGGYGSTRIIDAIDLEPLKALPKWIIGFSDVTAIHLKLYALGILSAHATMPILFSRQESLPSIASLRQLLFDGKFHIECSAHSHNRNGDAQGRLVGGNLSLIVDSLGTPTEVDTRNCILFIEEIDEYRYRLDRMLTQLRRAGKLRHLAGLVVGHMTDIKESSSPFGIEVNDIIRNAIEDLQIPVAFGFPSGHENPNLAWIHGAYARLRVSDRVTLSLSSPS